MSNIGVDWLRMRRERARLIILKALAEQLNGTLDSSMIEEIMPTFAISETRLWVHEQMEYLAERDAVTITKAGTVMIATLNKRGRRHLRREVAIEGVLRPSEPGE
ncbi:MULTISPECIES: hypothetical protein [unclassified Rhizobium]|uniref:VpaChn25_0724 family phage protein n=1 Tax=unclassified Rhizobium TaxID=2613769 RepID=UPI00288BDADD|nr:MULTISPECIES: hypothetical protein [unclassified Rhizobium]